MLQARAAFLALAFLVVACSGPARPCAGETGRRGLKNRRDRSGVQERREPPARRVPGLDGHERRRGVNIPVSCLSPCHGFNGVVSQFQTSVHYIGIPGFAEPHRDARNRMGPPRDAPVLETAMRSMRLQQRVTGNVLTSDDGGVAKPRERRTAKLPRSGDPWNASPARTYAGNCDRRRGLLHDLPMR